MEHSRISINQKDKYLKCYKGYLEYPASHLIKIIYKETEKKLCHTFLEFI